MPEDVTAFEACFVVYSHDIHVNKEHADSPSDRNTPVSSILYNVFSPSDNNQLNVFPLIFFVPTIVANHSNDEMNDINDVVSSIG